MRLIECYIENFGRLKDFKYSFDSGLNTFNEANGFGKTTLSVFIKAMLYGLEDTKKAKLEENDRKHYLPWQGGRFGGSLSFESAKGRFRIERSFFPKASDDEYTLYDLDTEKISTAYGSCPGEELFGIDADGFERTVFLSERRLSVKNDNKSISAKLSDLVGADADVGVLDDALKALEEKRKYYYKKGGSGKIGEIKERISQNEVQIASAQRVADGYKQKEERLALLDREISALEKERANALKRAEALSYKKQLSDMKSAEEECGARLENIRSRFGGIVPSTEEHMAAQRSYDEYTRLSSLKEVEPKARDTAERDKIDAYIKKLGDLGSAQRVAKNYHFLIIGALFSLAFGILLGAFVAKILYTVCAIAPICAIFAYSNYSKIKSSSEAELAIAPIADYVRERTQRNVSRDQLIAELLFLKSKEDAEIKLYEQELTAKRERDLRCKQEEAKYLSFIARYTVKCEDPLSQMREDILRYDILKREITFRREQLEAFKEKHKILTEDVSECEAETLSTEEIDAKIRALRSEHTLLLRECRDDAEEISTIDVLNEKARELGDELLEAEEYYATVLLTKEHLTNAKDRLTAKYLGGTRAAFNTYLADIGGERGGDFNMNTSFEVTKSEGGKSMPTEAYSLGVRDFYSLAARLALVDALYEDETPFIILDDPFVHLDDEKTKRALLLLEGLAKKRQILYFTCSNSRSL